MEDHGYVYDNSAFNRSEGPAIRNYETSRTVKNEEHEYMYDNPAFRDMNENDTNNQVATSNRPEIFVVSLGDDRASAHDNGVNGQGRERGGLEDTPRTNALSSLSSNARSCLSRVHERRGLFLVALASVLYSFKYILMNILSRDMSSYQAVVMIMPVLFIGSLILVIAKGVNPPKTLQSFLWLLVSGLSLAFYLGLFALSLTYIDVGDAVTILNTSLIFVGPLSWIILRERTLNLTDILFALLALAGVAFIARPRFLRISGDDEQSHEDEINIQLGSILAFGASMCLGLLFTSVRRQTREGVEVSMLMFTGSILVSVSNALVCTLAKCWTIPTTQDWIYSALTGASYFLAQSCLFLSLSLETATSVNIVLTLEIVITFLWQFLFFDIIPTWTSYAGTSCVLLSCIGHALLKPKLTETSTVDVRNVGEE